VKYTAMLFKKSDGMTSFFNILFAVVLSTTFRHNVHINCLLYGFPPYFPEFIDSNALHPRSLAQIYFMWLRS